MAQASEQNPNPLPCVFDARGTSYQLLACLGRGGQGSVWETSFPDRVVKLLDRRSAADRLRRRLDYVRGLPLDGLPIARPLELLRAPDVGYVATLLRDMVPLTRLCSPPPGSPLGEWYLSAGGLRRRLRLLAHAGEVFLELHGKGLAYVDVSPGNVFVSGSTEHEEAWLIDADNLRHDSPLDGAIYTPGYGAPEVIHRKSGPTSLSDAWGFAVLVYQVLTLVHPFCGDLVNDGPPEHEELAFEAQLPWVNHGTNPRNRASHGIPAGLVMGSRLLELARKTFEISVSDPLCRPGVAAWVDVLHATADQTLLCPACTNTFLVNAPECPWCGARKAPPMRLSIERWEPGHGVVQGIDPVARLALGEQPLRLTRRLTRGHVGPEARRTDGVLTPVEQGIQVQMTGGKAWLTREGVAPLPEPLLLETSPRTLPRRDPAGSWMLHLGPLDTPHRVLRFEDS